MKNIQAAEPMAPKQKPKIFKLRKRELNNFMNNNNKDCDCLHYQRSINNLIWLGIPINLKNRFKRATQTV